MTKRERPPRPEPAREPNEVDESSRESFPASDPPAWTPLHPGEPASHPDEPRDPRKRPAK